MLKANNKLPWLRAGLGLGFGLALCAGLIVHLDVREQDWLRLAEGFSRPWAGVVTALTLLLWWSGERKWALWSAALHGAAGAEPSPRFFWRHFVWQNWLGQFAPPSLTIILGRSWASRSMPGVGWRAGAGSAFYDQAMEFALLAGLLPAAVLVLVFHAPWTIWVPVGVLGAAIISGVIWLFCPRMQRGVQRSLLPLLGWSIVRVILTVARLAAGAPALGLAIDPVLIAAAAPAVALLFLIPVTPGNLGLAEWGWAGVLAYAGADPLSAGLLALGFRLLMLMVQSVLLAANEIVFFYRKNA